MQEVVRLLSQRLFQVLLVDRRYLGIVVGFADGLAFVLLVDGRDPCQAHLVRGQARLPAAPDAASGAGHDLYEVILLPALDSLYEKARVAQPVGNCDFHRHPFKEGPLPHGALYLHGRLFHAGKPGHGGHVQVFERELATGHDLVDGAQGRFHDAACVGKDVRGTRGGAEDAVHLPVGKPDKIDAGLADHPAQLPRGEHHVHVAHAA